MTVNRFEDALSGLRAVFSSGITRPLSWRIMQLKALGAFLRDRERMIAEAVNEDFRKSEAETFFTETGFLLGELRFVAGNLKRWMKPEKVSTPLYYQFARSYILRDPLGLVLVIGAWNYPVNLCLAPLIGALSGGNCVVVKPSETAPNASRVVAEGIRDYLDTSAVMVVEGGAGETRSLLDLRFDHVFFTGSRDKGYEVLLAAARNFTPVTLEMGGKCPCIVTEHTNLRIAARRIVWAKFINGGQTCIAPDYVLVHENSEHRLLGYMKDAIRQFYGPDPSSSCDYPRIISERHFRRLMSYVDGADIVTGGGADERARYIAPSVIMVTDPAAPVMQEEIFGPVLPVLAYSRIDEATGLIGSGKEPLAVYLFSSSREEHRAVIGKTRSGGVCINDLMFQAAVSALPFGGSGFSGMGSYHGRAGFDTFTSRRSVMHRAFFPDMNLRYPPYGPWKFRFLKRLLATFSG
jgi:acyl-CoA reductase-like NAD-dependent aldehyde dehydrogenase